MPCLWLTHNQSQVFVDVGVVDANVIGDIEDGKAVDIGKHMFRALVDTGAQRTMTSRRVVDQIGLRPIGKMQIAGVGGVDYHNSYLFQIAFVLAEADPGDNKRTWAVHVFPRDIEGAELVTGLPNFDVLLGMDVLSECSLALEGCGTFSLSF